MGLGGSKNPFLAEELFCYPNVISKFPLTCDGDNPQFESLFEGGDANPLSAMRKGPEGAPEPDPMVMFTANMARYTKTVMDEYKVKGCLDKNDNYKKYFGSAGTSGLSGALNAVKAATGVGTEAFEELPPENLEQAEEHYLRCLGEADGLLKKLEQIEEVCRSQTTDPQSQLDHRTPMRLQSEANLGWGLSNARIADARLKASYKRFKKEVAGRLAKGGAEDTAEATKVFPIPCKEVGGNESKEDEGGNYPTPSWCMFQKPFAKENVRGEYLSLFKNGRVDTGSGTMMAEVEKQVQY